MQGEDNQHGWRFFGNGRRRYSAVSHASRSRVRFGSRSLRGLRGVRGRGRGGSTDSHPNSFDSSGSLLCASGSFSQEEGWGTGTRNDVPLAGSDSVYKMHCFCIPYAEEARERRMNKEPEADLAFAAASAH